jgi:hypothetical protein
MGFDFLDEPRTTVLFSNFPKLKRLFLIDASFKRFSQLINIICACPRLVQIGLDGLLCIEKVDVSIDQQPPSHLQSLELGVCNMGACDKMVIIGWLLSSQLVCPLIILRTTSLALHEIPAVGALLRSIAPSLKFLELGSNYESERHSLEYTGKQIESHWSIQCLTVE